MRRIVPALTLAGTLAACSNNESIAIVARPPACDLTATTGTCFSDPAETSSTCTTAGGTWLESGCPSGPELVGICYESGDHVVYYYSSNYGLFASHDAAQACANAGGKFYARGTLVTASCDLRSTYGFCVDLSGTVSDVDPTNTSYVCTSLLSGTWSETAACTASGRTGTCSFVSGGVQEDIRYYSETTALDANCTRSDETWTPG